MALDVDRQLAGWVRDKLRLPPSDNTVNGHKSDLGNWVIVWNSFQGIFATPAPGTIEFPPDTRDNQALVSDYLRFLAELTGVALGPLALGDPLHAFFAQVIASEKYSAAFLEVLRKLQGKFELKEAIAGWADAGLPVANAWATADERYVEAATRLSEKIEYDYEASRTLRGYRWRSGRVLHDQRQYLLFGQDAEQITPFDWIQAAWPFIQHFRVNFGMFVTEASIYDRVTIIGSHDIEVPVTESDEAFLRESGKEDGSGLPAVERLAVNSPKELTAVLEERVAQNKPFGGPKPEK